jgi:hypothetical protein
MGEDLNTPRFKPLRAVLALSLLALVAIVAGCGGGGGSSEDAKATIDKAFSTPIKSANLALALEANVDGLAQLQGPVTVKLSGPFQSNGKGKLPSLDWDASFSGGGQSLTGGVTSTGDQLFVNFRDQDYEVPKAQVDQINQQLASQSGQNKTLADYGIDPKNWVTDTSTEDDETVNGAETTHVTATVDIEKMLNDLNKTIQQAGAMGTPAQQLTPQQISQIKDVVKDPKMDVYVAKEDDTLRRLNLDISFTIPEDQQASAQGATGGNIKFSVDFSDVGAEQTIQAPANAKPLNQLQGALGGLAGGTGTTTPPDTSGSGSGSAGGGSSPDAEKLQKYSQCLEKAGGDPAAAQKCQALLN